MSWKSNLTLPKNQYQGLHKVWEFDKEDDLKKITNKDEKLKHKDKKR